MTGDWDMQMRQHTAASWVSNNPTPSLGQWCLETDTKLKKVGDGVTAWNSLAYCRGDTAVQPDAIGTAAALDAGTADGNVVVVATGGKLPALDGRDLTNLPGGSGGGKLAQYVYATTTTATTTTAVIPDDDTLPQNTEGTEILTCSITPTNASSILIVEFVCPFSKSAASSSVAALFVDSTANALAAVFEITTYGGCFHLKTVVSAGTTAPRTYKIRVGQSSATLYILKNNAGTEKFSTADSAILSILEVLP